MLEEVYDMLVNVFVVSFFGWCFFWFVRVVDWVVGVCWIENSMVIFIGVKLKIESMEVFLVVCLEVFYFVEFDDMNVFMSVYVFGVLVRGLIYDLLFCLVNGLMVMFEVL